MGEYRTIRVATQGRVAEIALAKPPLNILAMEMMNELSGAFQEVLEGDARVVLLYGEGSHFSAGADVREHLPEQATGLLATLRRLFLTLAAFERPIVGAVHGSCLGAGMELAMACDVVVAAEDSRLGLPEIRLGALAPIAAAQLPELVGPHRAAEILLTGRSLTALEARDWGLVNAVVGPADLLAKARETASRIAAFSRPVLAVVKRALSREESQARALSRALDLYRTDILPLHDAREGLAAFLEKREPRWEDR